MENLSAFVKLLGEENEEKFRNSITDKLIECATDDIERLGDCLVDWGELLDDIYDELKEEAKRKTFEFYEKMAEEYKDNPRLAELVAELKALEV